jgi:hypothetical protein
MTLTGWALLLSFAGAIVLAVTAFQLRTHRFNAGTLSWAGCCSLSGSHYSLAPSCSRRHPREPWR